MTNEERKELLEKSGHLDSNNHYTSAYTMRQSVACLRQIKDMSHYTGNIRLITPFGVQHLESISYFTAEHPMGLGDNSFYVQAIPKEGSLAEQEARNTFGRIPVCETRSLLCTYLADNEWENNGLGEYRPIGFKGIAIAAASELNKFLYMGIPVVDVTMWEGYGLLFTGVSGDAANEYYQYLLKCDE